MSTILGMVNESCERKTLQAQIVPRFLREDPRISRPLCALRESETFDSDWHSSMPCRNIAPSRTRSRRVDLALKNIRVMKQNGYAIITQCTETHYILFSAGQLVVESALL